MKNTKNSVRNGEFLDFEVGDIVRIGDSKASMVYILTMKMPAKDPSYYQALAANGSIATLWKGSIREKLGHYDLEGLFQMMENDIILEYEGGARRCSL